MAATETHLPQASGLLWRGRKMVWAAIPLEEILGIRMAGDGVKISLAQRAYVFTYLDEILTPTDKDLRHYVELGEFLKNMQA